MIRCEYKKTNINYKSALSLNCSLYIKICVLKIICKKNSLIDMRLNKINEQMGAYGSILQLP